MPVKLFVIGATGRTGGLVVRLGLVRGHAVTAMLRGAESQAPVGATIMQGDVLDAAALAEAMAGHDAVISVLGHRRGGAPDVLERGARAVLEALARTGVRRYLVVSQGLLFPSRNPLIALLRGLLAATVRDSTAMELLVTSSAADWTIVRPPRLTEGGTPQGYRAVPGARPRGSWSMDRADLAVFLVDEAERADYPRTIVGIGTAVRQR